MGDFLKGYLHVKCAGQSRLARKAWRKRWLVMEFPPMASESPTSTAAAMAVNESSEVDRLRSVLVRVYSSHVHENRGPPVLCIQVLEIHGLHRIQSRSQPYAFSVDGSSGELVAAGRSETETQHWIRGIRSRVWRCHSSREKAGYQVSLIDNVHSDVARLRGFYGDLRIDRLEGEIVLVEERSGAEQVRWSLDMVNRVFCPKTISKKDKDKILVIITKRRSKSIGQGIFTFFSADAKEIHADISAAIKWWGHNMTSASDGATVLPRSGRIANPLAFLFSRAGQDISPAKAKGAALANTVLDSSRSRNHPTKQETGRKKVLEKSQSMVDYARLSSNLHRPPNHRQELHRLSLVDSNSSSEGDSGGVDYGCGTSTPGGSGSHERTGRTPSSPPFPSPPDDQPISNLLQEGHYYRFDREQKYDVITVQDGGSLPRHHEAKEEDEEPGYGVIQDGAVRQYHHHSHVARGRDCNVSIQDGGDKMSQHIVMAGELGYEAIMQDGGEDQLMMDDALLQLQSIERSLLELSQQSSLHHSHQQHLNNQHDVRLSYISVDSGRSSDTYAETSASSIASSSSSTNNNNIGSNNNSHVNRLNSNASNCSSSADSGTDVSSAANKGQSDGDSGAVAEKVSIIEDQLRRFEVDKIYCCATAGISAPTPHQPEAIYARIQARSQERRVKTTREESQPACNHNTQQQLTPRFATIRKSHTLPHNICNYQEEKERFAAPGYSTLKTMRPEATTAVLEETSPEAVLLTSAAVKCRPASLRIENRKLLRSGSVEEHHQQPVQRSHKSQLNRKLELVRSGEPPLADSGSSNHCNIHSSAPSTPLDTNRCFVPTTSTRRVADFSEKVYTTTSNSANNLFNSTPDNLDSGYGDYGRLGGWQSSDGLITPVSLSGRSPIHTPISLKGLSPLATPTHRYFSSPLHTNHAPVQTRAASSLQRKKASAISYQPAELDQYGQFSGQMSADPSGGLHFRLSRSKKNLRGSDSMFSLRIAPSPRRSSCQNSQTVVPHSAADGAVVSVTVADQLRGRRFHSIPRSCTAEGLAGSASASPSRNYSGRGTSCHYSQAVGKSSGHYADCVGSSQSLDNLICEARRELSEENIYMEMGRNNINCSISNTNHKEATGRSSDYLDMDKTRQQQGQQGPGT